MLFNYFFIVFTGNLRRGDLEDIADSDNSEAVSLVKECYCNLHPITSDCFTTFPYEIHKPVPGVGTATESSSSVSSNMYSLSTGSSFYSVPLHLCTSRVPEDCQNSFSHWIGTITSSMLCQNFRPVNIRYLGASQICRMLAEAVSEHVHSNADIWNGKNVRPVSLLLFDRREDPVTPLLFSV